jgi:hypothetical protein
LLRLDDSFNLQVVTVDLPYEVIIVLFYLGDQAVELDFDEEVQMASVTTQFFNPVEAHTQIVEVVVEELAIKQHSLEIFGVPCKMGLIAAL